MGNPTTYRGKSATWKYGRRLISFDGNTFKYDGQGHRIEKNGITFTYDSQNRLIKQSNGLEFFYDNTGLLGLKYNSKTYIYQKDIQGNIIAVLDSNGNIVVEYFYDAWGNHEVSGSLTIGNLNPFRYRSYYYDTETGLYYLQTRYYDPEVGRFITIDNLDYINPDLINGMNLYAYCNNNPVMNIDPSGELWWLLAGVIGLVVGVVGQLVSDCLSGEKSSWQDYIGAAVGGFVAGSLSTICGPTVASVAGSLATDAITLGLNIITGQETRSVEQIVLETTENAILSATFSFGSNVLSNTLSINTNKQLFKPIFEKTAKVTAGVFFKELVSETVNSFIEAFVDSMYYNIKRIIR